MMKPMSMPQLLVSTLFVAHLVAAPAAAADGIAALHNGRAVVLRAEYVPASQFAAAAQPPAILQSPPQSPVQPALAQAPQAWSGAAYAQGGAPPAGDALADQAYYEQAPDAGQGYEPAAYAPDGYNQNVPPLPVVIHTRQVVPVAYPVPVGFAYGGGWNSGWGNRWNRGVRPGLNRGFNRGWGWNRPVIVGPGFRRGWGGYGRNQWRGGQWGGGQWGGGCRATGSGALVGSIAGATVGYGLANPWNRGSGVLVGGIVGALAGSALERSGRC